MEVQENLEKFQSRGLRVVAIGQGTGAEARSFCKKWGVEYPCLGDPQRQGYEALNLARGSWWTVALRSLLTRPVETISRIARADMGGARLESTDVLQLGGVAIVDQQGTLRAIHRAESPEDMPTSQEILDFAWQTPGH